MAHVKGNAALQTAMGDATPQVRAAAVKAWRDVLGQTDAVAGRGLLTDSDASVRAEAAAVIGAFAVARGGRRRSIAMVTTDTDPTARRNAAWALGKIGDSSARAALVTASGDSSADRVVRVAQGCARVDAALSSVSNRTYGARDGHRLLRRPRVCVTGAVRTTRRRAIRFTSATSSRS